MYKEYLISLKSENISKQRHQEKLTSLINKKTIRYHLNKLIREYNILPKKRTPLTVAKHVIKTLFWATVYLAFSYLTITWSFEVIQQYRDNQTITNMKAVINNNITYLPNMTICVKINTSELFNIHSTSSLNYTSAWSRFFNQTISSEGMFIVNEGQIYDDEIYLSLLKYLAMIYEAERAWEPGLTQISTFHSEESDDWTALKRFLIPHIGRYNITLEQLKSIFDGKFCNLPGYYPNTYSYLLYLDFDLGYESKCIKGSKISFIGLNTICFRLIGYQISLQQLGSAEPIVLSLYADYKHQKWCQEFTIDLGSESRSTPRRATMRNETYSFYYDRFTGGVHINMDIGVRALYRKLPYVKGEVQCSSDTTREECENKCLKGWIRANCHCSPATFNFTDISSYRNCSVDDYSTCLEKHSENATYLCINKCVPLCEQWHYDFGIASSDDLANKALWISLKTYDYVIIEQVFACPSFEEFIGALGGALGIWLGLDFVIIIEFIVSLLTRLSKKILLRNVHNSEGEKHEESASIKHREENIKNGISSSSEIGSRVVRHQKECKENESEIVGTSTRQKNESGLQRTSRRKKRESSSLKEKHVQQRRKRSNNNRVDRAILDDNMKNIDSHDGCLRNRKVNIADNVYVVQDESIAHANNSSVRNLLLQKMLLLILNGDLPTNKPAVFLRLIKKLFWAVIYLVGSVFTTLWCVKLINLYLADEAVYFPSLITNRTVSLPPPSICIKHSFDYFFTGHGKMFNALMDYFGQSNFNRESFIQISNDTDWPRPLVSIGLVYLGILAASETDYNNVSFIYKYERQLDFIAGFNNTRLRNDLDKSINEVLLPKLLEWNVTATELRQKLGAELARIFELKISFTDTNGTIFIVNETTSFIAAINDKFFCYSLPYGFNFTGPDDVLEFSINGTLYPQFMRFRSSYIVFSDYLLEPKKFSFTENGGTVYGSSFLFNNGYEMRTLISVDGLYTSRPAAKGVKHCSPNTTKSYCLAQCRIELIKKLCNCSPLYWTAMIQPTSGLDECTFDRYMECLNFDASDDRDCRDSCLPSCTAQYSHSYQSAHYLSQEYSDIAVIRLSITEGIYASIEEKPTFTFSEMLIKLGGTLGILLGFSIFSFYRVLAKTVALCFAVILKRTRFAQSSILLKSLDKIKKSGIAQLISEVYRKLHVMKICNMKRKIKLNDIGKNILLSIGYMIGLYATVRMGNDLFYSFKSGELKCLVDLMMHTTIKLPSSTICMPLDAVEFLSKKEIKHLKQNTNLTRSLYFNSYNDKKYFSEQWPKWLIYWIYEYLTIYDIVERHSNQKFISACVFDNDSCALTESRNTVPNSNLTSLMELDGLIDHLNITISELKQNLGQKVRDIYKTEAVFVKEMDGAWNQTVLNITDTTFIGKTKVCYKLPLDTVTFSSKSDYIFILVDRRSLPNPQYPGYDKPITIDFSGSDFSEEISERYFLFESILSSHFYEISVAKLDISGIYEGMPVSSGVRHCSESKSMDTCLDKCQLKKIERICHCSPVPWSSSPTSTNFTRCRLIDYKRCAEFLVSSDADLCELSCVPRCTRISFKNIPRWDGQSISYNVAEIKIILNSFEYLSYKEVYKYTMADFISEFGGVLGLWIGLDFLALADLIYWLVCKGWHIFRQFL